MKISFSTVKMKQAVKITWFFNQFNWTICLENKFIMDLFFQFPWRKRNTKVDLKERSSFKPSWVSMIESPSTFQESQDMKMMDIEDAMTCKALKIFSRFFVVSMELHRNTRRYFLHYTKKNSKSTFFFVICFLFEYEGKKERFTNQCSNSFMLTSPSQEQPVAFAKINVRKRK